MLAFDLVIAVAYFAIPLELLYCFLWYPFPVRAKPAIVCILFITFITLCALTHLVRAFGLESAVPVITGLCGVISVLTAVMLLWLIPELFKLAKSLETERSERLMLENFQATLKDAVEGPEEKMDEASMNLMKAIPYCSNRQLRAMAAAKASLARMFRSKSVDVKMADGLKMMPEKVVLPINHLFVIVADADVHAQHSEMLDRMSMQIAKTFRDADSEV